MHTLTEQEINTLAKSEIAELCAPYGGDFWAAPWDQIKELGERQRMRWVTWVAERDRAGSINADGTVTERRSKDKTARLQKFVAEHVGMTINVLTLQELCECSRGTAHRFIADNRSTFAKAGRGQYVIIDTSAARAADRRGTAATSPVVVSESAAAVSATLADVDAAMGAMHRGIGAE